MEPFDTTRPNIARVWDYWLGGKDNFAADRELAEKMLAVHPVTAQMARENRQFLGRAVSYVAARGIRQFIDVGAGLPTVLNTHDIAQYAEPAARVAYVDNDPVVISHARSLLAKSPGVIAVPGDMREPERILADPGLTELIDLAKPACVIMSGVLHFADPGTACDIAAAFIRALAPGSYLIISVGSGSPSEGENFTSAYTAAQIYIHSPEEIEGFFGDLDLVPPGVVSVRDWSGDDQPLHLEPLTATFVAGVARKADGTAPGTCPGQYLSMPDMRSPEAAARPGAAADDELVDSVLAASRALVAVAARSLAAAGDEVTLPQYRALVVLAARGPQGAAELAAALAVNPSTATRMCDRLVRKGLVRRHRQAGDRRAVRIVLTAAGRDLVAEVTRCRRAELARLLGALPAPEHEPVIAAFRAFATAAGELPEPGAALGWAGP